VDNVNVYYTTFNVIICMETFVATLSTNRFLIHTKYASIRSSCIYEDFNYPFEDDIYIYSEITLNCVEPCKGSCVELFTKIYQFDLVLTDTENNTKP